MFLRLTALACIFLIFTSYSSSYAYEEVFERNYTKTTIKYPKECKLKQLAVACGHITETFVQRFEHDRVIDINSKLDFDTDMVVLNSDISTQEVELRLLHNTNKHTQSFYAITHKNIEGEKFVNIDVFNIDKTHGLKNLTFDELFERSDIAKMIIARAVEKKFLQFNATLLPVIVALMEVAPRNFAIGKNGLVLFFAPGQVNEKSKSFDILSIKIEDLKDAKPKARYWTKLKDKTQKS